MTTKLSEPTWLSKSVSLGGAELSHINWQVGHIDPREILKVDRVPAFTLQKTKTHTHTLPCTCTPGRVEMLQESPAGAAGAVVQQQHQAWSLIHTTT